MCRQSAVSVAIEGFSQWNRWSATKSYLDSSLWVVPLLRLVGRRHLHDNTLYNFNNALRLIFPTPNWEDFVQLAICKLRLYGATPFQVTRRLFATLIIFFIAYANLVSLRCNAS
jgi:hypothetical protein